MTIELVRTAVKNGQKPFSQTSISVSAPEETGFWKAQEMIRIS
jgi:hypothetical protein